jgi:hypothetical protein
MKAEKIREAIFGEIELIPLMIILGMKCRLGG